MGILKDVTQTVKNIFNADDDVMFDDEVEFADSNQQNMFSIPKPFAKKTNDGLKNPASNKMQAFDLSNHGFEAAKNNQTRARSNGKIQVYVPKSFEEAFKNVAGNLGSLGGMLGKNMSSLTRAIPLIKATTKAATTGISGIT